MSLQSTQTRNLVKIGACIGLSFLHANASMTAMTATVDGRFTAEQTRELLGNGLTISDVSVEVKYRRSRLHKTGVTSRVFMASTVSFEYTNKVHHKVTFVFKDAQQFEEARATISGQPEKIYLQFKDSFHKLDTHSLELLKENNVLTELGEGLKLDRLDHKGLRWDNKTKTLTIRSRKVPTAAQWNSKVKEPQPGFKPMKGRRSSRSRPQRDGRKRTIAKKTGNTAKNGYSTRPSRKTSRNSTMSCIIPGLEGIGKVYDWSRRKRKTSPKSSTKPADGQSNFGDELSDITVY